MIAGDLDFHVGYGRNEYGTLVSLHVCRVCTKDFTCCPAQDAPFGGCLTPGCGTYDPSRDAEVYFRPDDPELIEGSRGGSSGPAR